MGQKRSPLVFPDFYFEMGLVETVEVDGTHTFPFIDSTTSFVFREEDSRNSRTAVHAAMSWGAPPTPQLWMSYNMGGISVARPVNYNISREVISDSGCTHSNPS